MHAVPGRWRTRIWGRSRCPRPRRSARRISSGRSHRSAPAQLRGRSAKRRGRCRRRRRKPTRPVGTVRPLCEQGRLAVARRGDHRDDRRLRRRQPVYERCPRHDPRAVRRRVELGLQEFEGEPGRGSVICARNNRRRVGDLRLHPSERTPGSDAYQRSSGLRPWLSGGTDFRGRSARTPAGPSSAWLQTPAETYRPGHYGYRAS